MSEAEQMAIDALDKLNSALDVANAYVLRYIRGEDRPEAVFAERLQAFCSYVLQPCGGTVHSMLSAMRVAAEGRAKDA